MAKIQTPVWVAPLWRFIRVFLAGFIAEISIDAFVRGDQDIRLQVLQAAVTGGIAAIFKYYRDTRKSEIVDRIPL